MNYDLKKATELIEKETSFKGKDAADMAKKINNLHPNLESTINKWLNGEKTNFTFNGISLYDIMKKKKCSFFSSLFTMTVLMNKPELADHYKDLKYYKQ